MERNQFWMFFGFALLLGLMAAAYQHAAGFSLGSPHLRQSKIDEDGPMYSGNDHLHLRMGVDGTSSFGHAGALTAHPSARVAGAGPAVKPAVKPPLKLTAKKDDKKKAKKKDGNAQGLQNPGDLNAGQGDGHDGQGQAQNGDGSGGGGSGAPGGGGSGGSANGGANNNGIPVTLADWEKYILTTPDITHTRFMIQMYQTGILKSDIYFQVLNMMIADSRTQMRALGVMAAGAAPSTASFTILVNEDYNAQEDSSVRSQATAYLRAYSNLPYLKFLLSVLSENSSAPASLTALALLQISAKPFVTTVATQTTANTASVSPTAAQMRAQYQVYVNARDERGNEQTYAQNSQYNAYNESSMAETTSTLTPLQIKINKYFAPFLAVVTSLAKSSGDTSVRTAAIRTLATLTSILPAATTTTTPVTASNVKLNSRHL